MRVIHIVAGLWKDTGGPSEVIPNLCQAQAEAGAHVTLCTIEGDIAPQVNALQGTSVEVKIFAALESVTRFSPTLSAYLNNEKNVDIIHNHGHWLWPNWHAASTSRKHGRALVTTPHGTLVPGMLGRSRLKKALAWTLFDRRLIEHAHIIHALSAAELNGMAPKLGHARAKTIVIPNGVHLPDQAGDFAGNEGGTLLFLSRLAPIKGIIMLLEAWRNVSCDYANWHLKLVGPIDRSIEREIELLVRQSERVEIVGAVYGDERWKHYQSASAFILPTLGEGLPTALLEAAAHRLPIITTAEANFGDLADAGGSLICRPDRESLEQILRQFFELPGAKRKTIGENAANLIKMGYCWPTIGTRWLSEYSRIKSDVGH